MLAKISDPGRVTNIAVLALLNGCAVGSLYLYQSIAGVVASHIPDADRLGWMPITATFLGYCAGNGVIAFYLARHVSKTMRGHLLLLAVALCAAGLAPTMVALVSASFLVGFGASVAQRLLGAAARIAGPARAGGAVSICVAVALLAVLVLRLWGEQLGGLIGWRTMFFSTSVGPLLAACFGSSAWTSSQQAADVQDVPVKPVRLFATSRLFRQRMVQQAMVFASYNAAWVLVVARTAASERAVTTACAPAVGIAFILVGGFLVDAGGARRLNRIGNLGMLVAGCPMLLLALHLLAQSGARHATAVFGLLPMGMALIDAGLQVVLVSNQTEVQALGPSSHGRLAAFLTMSGSVGSALGGGLSYWLWQHQAWQAGIALIATTAAIGLYAVIAPWSAGSAMPQGDKDGQTPRPSRRALSTPTPALSPSRAANRMACGIHLEQGSLR